MTDWLVTAILNEGGWFMLSLAVALAAVAALLAGLRGSDLPGHEVALAALNLSAGTTVGCMAFGHLLAVTTKLLLGTLAGSVPTFYAIGAALAVPSWWVIAHTARLSVGREDRRTTVRLHTWLVATLLVLGLPNLPLAVPSVLTIAFAVTARPVARWAIVGVAVAVNVGLFVGSLIFVASGRTFEQFSGID
jgi:hypothetical protein